MRMYIVASKTKIKTANSTETYIPYPEMMAYIGGWSENKETDTYLAFELEDVNGANLRQVLLEDNERRNGLPTHSYSYGFDGTTHIFPLHNFSIRDTEDMIRINKIMVYPYTYFFFYGGETLREQGMEVYWRLNQLPPLQPRALGHSETDPAYMYFVRTVMQQITTIENNQPYLEPSANPDAASKEFDIDYSLYGVWDESGLLEGF